MASQDPPTNVIRASTPGVYDTAKECFVGLATKLQKGFSPPVFTNDRDVIITVMPSGRAFRPLRDIIQNLLELLHQRLSQQIEWEKVHTMSKDKGEFSTILYRSDAYSKEGVIKSTLPRRSEMTQLAYTKGELSDSE